jgi:hypothetical protein
LKGFSTQLVDLTLEDIKRGIFRTTGGTDLNLPLIDTIKSKKKKNINNNGSYRKII